MNNKAGSGRVFPGSGIWPKIQCGIWENAKYLDGKRDLTAAQEAGFTKIWARHVEFFTCQCPEFGKSPSLSLSLFSLHFVKLRYEKLFFYNTLKHPWIQNINQKGQSTGYIYQLLQQLVFLNLSILETKNRIRESNEEKCGMWDFHEKEAGIRDQDPPSRPW